jgi:hypothetical protein
MIGDLLRAFVEAVIVRAFQSSIPPGARIERLYVAGFDARHGECPLIIEWSTT